MKDKREVSVLNDICLVPIANSDCIAICDKDDYDMVSKHNWFMYDGYIFCKILGKRKGLHQLILPKCQIVDHINRNRLDNRRSNLRIADYCLNSHNVMPQTDTGFKGVYWHPKSGKFRAMITQNNGKVVHIGLFYSPVAAARAYDVAAIERYGKEASLNFGKHYKYE